MATPEGRVELLVEAFADDDVQRRAEHVAQCAGESTRPLGHLVSETTESRLEQKRPGRYHTPTV